jgi:HEPN domain-containing protein
MKNKDKIEYWIDISRYDLKTIKVMLEGKRYLYVGFMCHQVIEKILKGYYIFINNQNPPYTHNLFYLTKQCKLYEELSEKQKSLIDTLEPMNISSRYPEDKKKLLKALNRNKCIKIINETVELWKWIKKKLSK